MIISSFLPAEKSLSLYIYTLDNKRFKLSKRELHTIIEVSKSNTSKAESVYYEAFKAYKFF